MTVPRKVQQHKRIGTARQAVRGRTGTGEFNQVAA